MLASQRCNYNCVKLFQQLSFACEIKQVWNNISSHFQCVIEKRGLNFLCSLLAKCYKSPFIWQSWVGWGRKEKRSRTSDLNFTYYNKSISYSFVFNLHWKFTLSNQNWTSPSGEIKCHIKIQQKIHAINQ